MSINNFEIGKEVNIKDMSKELAAEIFGEKFIEEFEKSEDLCTVVRLVVTKVDKRTGTVTIGELK